MKLIKLKVIIMAAVMFAASSAFAALSYNMSLDTNSIAGTTGYVDFQFNPGIDSAGSAFALISNFTSDGTLIDPAVLTGGVSGKLPATVALNDSTQFNDYFHQFTFGKQISFNLNLSGTPGSTFGFAAFSDANGTPALPTTDPNGFALTVDMNKNGTLTPSIFTGQASATPTPVPAAAWLFGSGLLGMVGIRRKKDL